MKKNLHKLKIKILCWLGLAIDISSTTRGVAGILSNFTENHFVFDEVECDSMEGFLQSLKHTESKVQERICSLVEMFKEGLNSIIAFLKAKIKSLNSPNELKNIIEKLFNLRLKVYILIFF